MHQSDLKQAAGVKATGRKLEKPVYTYSLAWAQDETPSREDMVTAAQDSLKSLGMEDQQAVLVAHNDTQHPHIHVILNRVHPETGKAASTSKDHLKLSKWAEGYERGQGKIRVQPQAGWIGRDMTKDDKPISTEGVQPDLNAMHIIKPSFSLDLNAMDIPSWERAKSRADMLQAWGFGCGSSSRTLAS